MINVNFKKNDMKLLEKDLNKISRSILPKATVSALNKIGRTVESAAIKAISKRTGVKQARIRKQIKPLSLTASRTRRSYTINSINAKAANIIEGVTASQRNPHTFRRRTKKGFVHQGVRASSYGVKKIHKGSFIGKGKGSGKMLVLARNADDSLKSLLGASPRQIFARDSMQRFMKQKAAQRLRVELPRAINQQLRRFGVRFEQIS